MTSQPEGTGEHGRPRWKVWLFAGMFLAAALVGGDLYLRTSRATPLTGKHTIVLADFVNTTGDLVFARHTQTGALLQLEQSPFLSLVTEERIQGTPVPRPASLLSLRLVGRRVPKTSLPVDDLQQFHGFLIELELNLPYFVDCELTELIRNAGAPTLVLIIDIDFTSSEIDGLGLCLRVDFPKPEKAIGDPDSWVLVPR